MKQIIDYINEAVGDHRTQMAGSIAHDSCPGHVMHGGNHKHVFKKGDVVYINRNQDINSSGTQLKEKDFRPARVVGIRVLKSSKSYPGSQYLIDYSYDDEDNRNVYTMNAKDIWNEIHVN